MFEYLWFVWNRINFSQALNIFHDRNVTSYPCLLTSLSNGVFLICLRSTFFTMQTLKILCYLILPHLETSTTGFFKDVENFKFFWMKLDKFFLRSWKNKTNASSGTFVYFFVTYSSALDYLLWNSFWQYQG